ncbi:MAG: YdcF family protein [Erysipelotrichaceae bacterium]|nr:YdcF family protein [Erysipelotrichaceae bacterium]
MDEITDTIRVFGPILAIAWIITIASIIARPQNYFNSMLLLGALLVTMLFVASFFGEYTGMFLLACFLIIMAALFMVPLLLIINGIQMIKRESFCLAHVLSLVLGVVVGIGEIAAVIYVLGLSDFISLYNAEYWILLLIFTVFYFSFLVLSFVIYSVFIQIMPHRMNFDYIIIHGCGLIGGEKLSRLLSNRVDKAIEIYNKCKKKPVIIPSGGKGEDEKLSEAEAMKNYLLEHGIPEEDILVEDKSATTRENLINFRNLIDVREGKKKIALVSSNYHIYRCLRLAKEVGLKCTGIGAKVAFYYWPSALIREFIAVFLEKRFLIRALIGYLLFISPILYALLNH